MSRVDNNIIIEGARIAFRNFSGVAGKFNPPGRKNFCVLLDSELAETLVRDGWNVRFLKPRDEYDEPQAYLSVMVSFDNIPPNVTLVTRKNKQRLDAESVNILDFAEIANVDLTIRPYNWEVSGKTGVKAYLKTMYVTLVEDEFADKYEDTPDCALNGTCRTL